MKLVILMILNMFILISCSTSQKSMNEEYNRYLLLVTSKKSTSTKKEYKKFLMSEVQNKQSHLQALDESYSQEGEMEIQHQSSGGGSSDIQSMNLRSSKLKLHNLNDRMNLLKKEIFLLNSQISALN